MPKANAGANVDVEAIAHIAPATLAATMEELVVEGGLDSIQLLFPDYIKGLKTFHAEVLPLVRRRELVLTATADTSRP